MTQIYPPQLRFLPPQTFFPNIFAVFDFYRPQIFLGVIEEC